MQPDVPQPDGGDDDDGWDDVDVQHFDDFPESSASEHAVEGNFPFLIYSTEARIEISMCKISLFNP